jgi:hypothetical protein
LGQTHFLLPPGQPMTRRPTVPPSARVSLARVLCHPWPLRLGLGRRPGPSPPRSTPSPTPPYFCRMARPRTDPHHHPMSQRRPFKEHRSPPCPLFHFFPGCAPSSEGNHPVAFPFKPSRRSFTFGRLRVTAAAVPPSLSELHPCRLFLLGWTSPHPPPSAPVPQDSPKPPLRAATTPERHCSSLPSPPHWCHTARVSPSLCHHA